MRNFTGAPEGRRRDEHDHDHEEHRHGGRRGRRGFGPMGPGGEGFGPMGMGGRGFGPGGPRAGFGPGSGPGRPGFGPDGLGPGPFGRGPHRGGGRRGGRGGRGDVRAAVLLLLAEQPMHGYQLIQQIVARSGGVWTPSPGSVYPALAQLEDEGLVEIERVEGRKTASLTEAGRAHVEAHHGELGSPWDDVSGGVSHEARGLREEVGAVMGAARQVSHVGSPEQVNRAAQVLVEARKALYRILAEDEPTAGPTEDEPTS